MRWRTWCELGVTPTSEDRFGPWVRDMHLNSKVTHSGSVFSRQIQLDGREGNTGFYLVRPTKAGIEMHRSALEMAKKSKSTTNQVRELPATCTRCVCAPSQSSFG